MDYTYKLEKYNGMKTKHTCPSCGAKRRFTRYVDASGNYIADHVGRCDRESNCGYHLNPLEKQSQSPGKRFNTFPRIFSEPLSRHTSGIPLLNT
jgi:rubredoxin